MKKGIFLLFFAAVIVIGARFIFSSSNTIVSPSPSNEPRYTLATITDDVLVKHPAGDFTKMNGYSEVVAGDEIKTSAQGRAKLLYPNGTITSIEGDSHVVVERLNGSGDESRIRLVVGSMWSKIKNLLGTNEYYEVETGNIIASVRGTVFALEYRNNISTVYGLGDTVKVSVKGSTTPMPKTETTVSSGEKITVSGTPAVSGSPAPLPKETLVDADLDREVIKRALNDIDDDDEDDDHEGLKELLKRWRNRNTPAPSPSRTPTRTPSPSRTPTPTPTPTSEVRIESITPKTIAIGQQFAINGTYFMVGRDTAQVKSVHVGTTSVTFTIIDSFTIFAKPGSLPAGIYDVSITDTKDKKSTLTKALTIR